MTDHWWSALDDELDVEEELAKYRLTSPVWSYIAGAQLDIEDPRRAMLVLCMALESAKEAYLERHGQLKGVRDED